MQNGRSRGPAGSCPSVEPAHARDAAIALVKICLENGVTGFNLGVRRLRPTSTLNLLYGQTPGRL